MIHPKLKAILRTLMPSLVLMAGAGTVVLIFLATIWL